MKNRTMHLGKILALLAFAGGIAGQASAASTARQNVAIADVHAAVKPSAQKRFVGASDANPYKHHRREYRNQRQYRKWMRQEPHMRRSKKCKLK